MYEVSPYSIASLRIDLFNCDVKISHATGFLMPKGGRMYLVSNWHVLSGLDANSLTPMDKRNGAIPDRIVVHYRNPSSAGFTAPFEITLHDKTFRPFWLEHPLGRKVDLACIEVPIPTTSNQIFPTTGNSRKPLKKSIMSTCFIVGYPFGTLNVHDFPVWKSGTIASEPDFGHTGPSNLLVDATTSSGMSGSPVYMVSTGNIVYEDSTSFMPIGPNSHATEFLGVYSGRVGSSLDSSFLDLGIVWRVFLVQELLSQGVPSRDFLDFNGAA
jgi:hypothetical protein